MKLLSGRQDVGGILTPDGDDGLRMLYGLETKSLVPFELDETSTEAFISVGKFRFSQETFEKAKGILDQEMQSKWLVIDEVGKLEVEQDSGLEPFVTKLINAYRLRKQKGKLLLVIRDSLLQKAMEKYKLEDAMVITKLEILEGFL